MFSLPLISISLFHEHIILFVSREYLRCYWIFLLLFDYLFLLLFFFYLLLLLFLFLQFIIIVINYSVSVILSKVVKEFLALGFEICAKWAGIKSLCARFQVILHITHSWCSSTSVRTRLGHHANHPSCQLVYFYD